jgi:large subunit ribosomal protein L28
VTRAPLARTLLPSVDRFSEDFAMARVCQISGKKTVSGRQYTRRGLAKRKGGVGRKITGNNLRVFKPNVQKVRAVVDGRTVRLRVSAKLLSRGFVTKPLRRTWKPAEAAAVKAAKAPAAKPAPGKAPAAKA